MPFITLYPGDLVCDYATPKNLDQLKAMGVKGIARYLPTSKWKGITAREMNDILARGFALWLIFETAKDRAFKGAAHGTFDGKLTRELVDKLGFHGTIIWTLDTDAITKAQAVATLEYGRAFQAAVGRQCGAYVDGEVTALMSSPDEFCPIWTPNARWWSRLWPNYRHPWTHIIQQLPNNLNVDPGVVLREVQGWIGDQPTQPVPLQIVPTPPLARTRSPFRNERVVELQQVLASRGFYKAKIDGRFGRMTEAAVKLFQEWLGVEADGKYGTIDAGAYRARLEEETA